MSFGQRFHIEFLIVLLVVGILAATFLEYSKVYLRIVSLVEPSYYAQNLKIDMSSYFSLTGKWPEYSLLIDGDSNQFERSVSAGETSTNGDIKLLLRSRFDDLDGKAFDFILNHYEAGHGFIFNSWRCGGAENPAPYVQNQMDKNEISRLITDPICRRK